MQNLVIHTIGHSNHTVRALIDLLRSVDIDLLIDVRSSPYSRYAPHFNREALDVALAAEEIEYRHAVDLGGRPEDPGMYDREGHVLYRAVADSTEFRASIEYLTQLAGERSVAIMCGEEDPTYCHRRLLVGKVLADLGWSVRHIRGDGRIQEEAELPMNMAAQPGLFEEGDYPTWRSIRSVSQGSRRPSSLEH